eukprot:762760-Hanusia_phi.AAC.16
MAGVGIFFQQEPMSGRVYVASIVENGSADRSGVIKVNDVIVKVDDEDVQGQPLSTLRNLILGRQGTYVVLAFRRMTGTELYYYDVELVREQVGEECMQLDMLRKVRGTPEYFESLKKTQAVAEEKEKLLMQVRQQEQDIIALRHQNTQMQRGSDISELDSLKKAIALKDEVEKLNSVFLFLTSGQEIKGYREAISNLGKPEAPNPPPSEETNFSTSSMRLEKERLKEDLVKLTRRLESLKHRYDETVKQNREESKTLQASIEAEISAANSFSNSLNSEHDILKKTREERNAVDCSFPVKEGCTLLKDAEANSQNVVHTLQEALSGLDMMYAQAFSALGRDGVKNTWVVGITSIVGYNDRVRDKGRGSRRYDTCTLHSTKPPGSSQHRQVAVLLRLLRFRAVRIACISISEGTQ